MLYPLILSLCLGSAFAASKRPAAQAKPKVQATHVVPDSQQIEKDLQSLDWPQFRAVVEAVPKLKADVDAYGPLGWKYVEARYKTYPWKKSVDKLDDDQKRHLADLIRGAKR